MSQNGNSSPALAGPAFSNETVRMPGLPLAIQPDAGTYEALFDTSRGRVHHLNIALTAPKGAADQDFLVEVRDESGPLLLSERHRAPGDMDLRFEPKSGLSRLKISAMSDQPEPDHGDMILGSLLSGTNIRTRDGICPVERICAGDEVWTVDNGFQPVIANLKTALRGEDAWNKSRHRPILVSAGALGGGLPSSNLYVSPGMRLMLRTPACDDILSVDEILAPSEELVGLPGICQVRGSGPVDYHCLVLSGHQIVLAEHAPVETFLGDPDATAALSPAHAGLLADRGVALNVSPKTHHVRPQAPARLLRRLLDRSQAKGHPLVERLHLKEVVD